jgi:hypothetical protein
MNRRQLITPALAALFAAVFDSAHAASTTYYRSPPPPPPPPPRPSYTPSYAPPPRPYGGGTGNNSSLTNRYNANSGASTSRSGSAWTGGSKGSTPSALKQPSSLQRNFSGAAKPNSALANKQTAPKTATANASALKGPNSALAAKQNLPPRGSALAGASSVDKRFLADKKGNAQKPFNNSSGNCGPDQEWDPVSKKCVPKKLHFTPKGPGPFDNDKGPKL